MAVVSPRGDWWAFWNAMKTGVRIWRTGETKPVEVAYEGTIASVGVSPEGMLLALGRHEKVFVVDLIDTATGRLAARLEPGLPSNRKMPLAFSDDGFATQFGFLDVSPYLDAISPYSSTSNSNCVAKPAAQRGEDSRPGCARDLVLAGGSAIRS